MEQESYNSAALGVIGGGSIMTEYGNFRFNLGPGIKKLSRDHSCWDEKGYSWIGKYDLEEISLEFRSSANPTEMSYVLPKTVGVTKVYLLLGVKNTRIQLALIRVLSSGVGVYLSHFKNVWGSRIIFAGHSKVFT